MRSIWFLAVDANSTESSVQLNAFPENHTWKPEIGKELGDDILPCEPEQKFVVVKVFSEEEAHYLDQIITIERTMGTDFFSDGLFNLVSQCVSAVRKMHTLA